LLALLIAAMPALAKNGAPSRLFPYYEEDTGVLILGQVMVVGTRQEITVDAKAHYDFLLSTGIPDAEITDGSLVVVMLYCCGGKISESQSIWAYAPPALGAAKEDFVEVRMGRVPRKQDAGVVNTLTAVRQKAMDGGGDCRWLPDESYLWMRVVECGDMPGSGWLQRGKMRKLWYKPATVAAPVPTDATPVTPPPESSQPAGPTQSEPGK
jgi:hypothetical protein